MIVLLVVSILVIADAGVALGKGPESSRPSGRRSVTTEPERI